MSRREKILAIVVGLALGIVALDWYVLSPVFQAYGELHERQDAALANLQRARRLTRDQRVANERWKQMASAGLLMDASQAESQLLHAVRTWSRQSGLTLASVQPERAPAGTELREITFQTNATGTISAVTRFLHAVQTAKLPVRVRRLRIAAVEGREQLTVDMRLSTIYYDAPADRRAAADASTAAGAVVAPTTPPAPIAFAAPAPAWIAAAMVLGLQEEGELEFEGDAPADDDLVEPIDEGMEGAALELPAEAEQDAEADAIADDDAPSADAPPSEMLPDEAPAEAPAAAAPTRKPAPAAKPAPATPQPTRTPSSSSRSSSERASSDRSDNRAEDEPPTRIDDATWADYRVIVDRNIFNRNRQAPQVAAPRPPRETTTSQPPSQPETPPDPAGLYVLRGISDIDGQMHAFFEHTGEHTYRQVQVGDAIEDRTITGITLDHVTLRFEDQPLTIKVGSTLIGEDAQPVAADSADSYTGGSAPAATNPGLSSIEERMRQRRLQEAQQ